MKYSEYLQLRELLEINNVSIEEYLENPKLYEGIVFNTLSSLGKGLWNMAKKGMKLAVSKGISSSKKNELNQASKDIAEWILSEVKRGGNDKNHPIYNTLKKKREAEEMLSDKENKEKAPIARKAIRMYDKELANFLRKKVRNRVKSIEQKIAKNNNLTDKDKDALQEYWDDLSINLEIYIAEALSNADIIEEDTVEAWLKGISNVEKMGQGEKSSKEELNNKNNKV